MIRIQHIPRRHRHPWRKTPRDKSLRRPYIPPVTRIQILRIDILPLDHRPRRMTRPPTVRHPRRRAHIAVDRQPRRRLRKTRIPRCIAARCLPAVPLHIAQRRRPERELRPAHIRRRICGRRHRQPPRPRHKEIAEIIEHRLAPRIEELLIQPHKLPRHHRQRLTRDRLPAHPVNPAPHIAPRERADRIIPEIPRHIRQHRRPLRTRRAVTLPRHHEIHQIRIRIVAVETTVSHRHIRETVRIQRRHSFGREINLAHIELLAVRIPQIRIAVLNEYRPLKNPPIRQIELQQMRIRITVRIQLIDIEIRVRYPYNPAPLANLNRVVK